MSARRPNHPRHPGGIDDLSESREWLPSRQALTNVYIAEEALALPPQERQILATLLLESLKDDGRSDDQIRTELRARLDDPVSGEDAGLSFEEVFGEQM